MEIVKHLIRVCQERRAGYETASNKVGDPLVQNALLNLAFQSDRFIGSLSPFVTLHTTGSPEEHQLSEHFQDWMDFESAIPGNDLPAVIHNCETGEERAIEAYEEALENENSNSLRQIIRDQLLEMKNTLETLDELKQQVH